MASVLTSMDGSSQGQALPRSFGQDRTIMEWFELGETLKFYSNPPAVAETSVVQPSTGDDQTGKADSTMYAPLQAPMAETTLHKLYP